MEHGATFDRDTETDHKNYKNTINRFKLEVDTHFSWTVIYVHCIVSNLATIFKTYVLDTTTYSTDDPAVDPADDILYRHV